MSRKRCDSCEARIRVHSGAAVRGDAWLSGRDCECDPLARGGFGGAALADLAREKRLTGRPDPVAMDDEDAFGSWGRCVRLIEDG